MGFEGQTVLITGGGQGIGRACAERFREEGARVVVAQRSRVDNFESIQVDLSNPDSYKQVIDEVIVLTGGLDVLVNNAGVMKEATLDEIHIDDWHLTLAVNITAPAMLIKHALPYLRASNGRIVNVGSIEGLGANPRHPAYCASKGALHALTRAVAIDHGSEGIRCNAVAPGWIDTDLNNEFIDAQPDPSEFRNKIGGIHPLRRTGTPAEVAALVSWLASGDSGFITGQIYTIDGGRTAQLSLPK